MCAKTSIFDVWQGSEYASELATKVKDVSFLNQFELTDATSTRKNPKERAKRTSK